MNTTIVKTKENQRKWHLIDLADQTLGRVSTRIATILIGKHKVSYTPNLDQGDYVVAINASQIKVTGAKRSHKMYRHHTGYPDGFREYTFDQVFSKDPRKIIQISVSGMLPKNKLRAPRLKRLKIFVDDKHPYQVKINPINTNK